jgi:hypothetical protein
LTGIPSNEAAAEEGIASVARNTRRLSGGRVMAIARERGRISAGERAALASVSAAIDASPSRALLFRRGKAGTAMTPA